MTKLILGPIIGGLNDTQANIWGRTDGPATLYAWVSRYPDLNDLHQPTSQSPPLTAQNGFAGVVPISGLRPETNYYYTVTLDGTLQSPLVWPYPRFSTFPTREMPRSFSFVFGSCFLPKEEPSGGIFDHINQLRFQRENNPEKNLRFMLLMGDQIYADAYKYNSLGRCALSLHDYRLVYTYTWSQPPFQRLLQKIPAYMTLDDHEVDDDWTWVNMDRTRASIPIWDRFIRWWDRRSKAERMLTAARVKDALQAYWEHQGMHTRTYFTTMAKDDQTRYTLATNDPGSFAYHFNYGAAAFFVLDTRTMRVKPANGQHVMLGEGQWHVLSRWLDQVKDAYPIKFIVTSCAMLYQLRHDIARDRWTGFPNERRRFIDLLSQKDVQGVYLLAGDLHSAHAMCVEIAGISGLVPLWEFCSSPFEQKPTRSTRFRWLRKPLPADLVSNQELYFTYPDLNFGVVEVNLDEPAHPRVRFEVYGSDGTIVHSVDTP
jgi:alkaline phosphatase D